jgi:hypothetical protein
MASEQAIKERAMQIDPCAFKSYSGPARRDAQNAALDQARCELERESHGPRRYSIDEIDRMRKAISRVQPRNYMNWDLKPSVEDQLRTAMLGGVTAQDLEDKAALYWEAIRQRRAARDEARKMVTTQDMVAAEAIVADMPIESHWRTILVRRIEALIGRLRIGGVS